jgi:predicted dehydrogenase
VRQAGLTALGVFGSPRPGFDDVVFYTYLEDRAWVQAIRTGRPPSPGFADALIAHAVVDAAYRAADLGAPVAVEDR